MDGIGADMTTLRARRSLAAAIEPGTEAPASRPDVRLRLPDVERGQAIAASATAIFVALMVNASRRPPLAGWRIEGAAPLPRFGEGDMTGLQVTALEPARRIAWRCLGAADPAWIGTRIAFELSEGQGSTHVRLRHGDWRAGIAGRRYCAYRWGIFLLGLKRACERQASASA